MTMTKICKVAAIGLMLLATLSPVARGEDSPTLLFSYEVLNFDIHKIDPAKTPYEKRLALAEHAKTDELPPWATPSGNGASW